MINLNDQSDSLRGLLLIAGLGVAMCLALPHGVAMAADNADSNMVGADDKNNIRTSLDPKPAAKRAASSPRTVIPLAGSKEYAQLDQLLQELGKTLAANKANPAPVTVKPGDTLNKLSLKMIGSWPFKPEVLSQIVKAKNPDAFVAGNPNRLRPGALLRMPELDDARRLLLGLPPSREGEATAHMGDAPDERRLWVRYP
jgi:Tfp pilus assembly protein FimV